VSVSVLAGSYIQKTTKTAADAVVVGTPTEIRIQVVVDIMG